MLVNDDRLTALYNARVRMSDQFSANQTLGRTQSLGCAAVEITQRCNLDCSLCYLSENSESVKDIPIEEVYRRLDEVRRQYGKGIHVQITGGDPTLRKHDELVSIVQYAKEIRLYPALFTNGIAASRKLLTLLSKVGLSDVAFHVDTSQNRCGYTSETDLNTLRLEYIERSRGLGLMIMFNTTIHQGNFRQLPELIRFFIQHADSIGLVSFQLQADTGRGEWHKRDEMISLETIRTKIDNEANSSLPWDSVRIGHPHCHSYMPTLVINNHIYPVITNLQWFTEFLQDFRAVNANRHASLTRLIYRYGLLVLRQPKWWSRALTYLSSKLWHAKNDLFQGGGRVHKLSFFIHNFMDADNLDQERIDACSFMVMTTDGPVSMCAHNARRDEYILKPITVTRNDGSVIQFQPLSDISRKSSKLHSLENRETA